MYSKKLIAAALTVALALGGVVGVAIANEIAITASKRVEDLTTVQNDAGLEVVVKADENDPDVKAATEVLDSFYQEVKDGKDTTEELYGEEKADKIHEIINLAEDELAEINEAGPFVVKGEVTGDVKFTFEFPTVYKEGEKVAFVIGIDLNDDGKITEDEWVVLEGEANKDGAIEVTVPEDVLLKVQEHASIFTVVNKPGAVEKYADTTKSNQ